MGWTVLARLVTALQAAKLNQEKQVWLHLVSLLRVGLAGGAVPQAGRLSSLVSSFLARSASVLLDPLDPLYRTVCRAMLAKPGLELASVPEFHRLVTGSPGERVWLLAGLNTGLRDSGDYGLAARSNMPKVVLITEVKQVH